MMDVKTLRHFMNGGTIRIFGINYSLYEDKVYWNMCNTIQGFLSLSEWIKQKTFDLNLWKIIPYESRSHLEGTPEWYKQKYFELLAKE